MAAGLLMTSIRSAFRTEVRHKTECTELMHQLNLFFLEHAQRKLFMTFALVFVDFTHHKVHFVNAGHQPVLTKLKSGEVLHVKPKGVGLGISPKAIYHKETLDLKTIETLLLCTDGLIEARNAQGEELSMHRIEQVLMKFSRAKEISDGIHHMYADFSKEVERRDDETLLIATIS
jgi:sigma-B regulation protein RsbU (phosphoserine phosphatase)